jgi:hexosaminidase
MRATESYTLDVAAAGASIKAQTIGGALRGLESFSQLTMFNFTSSTYNIVGAPWAIQDTPRFQHRGLMIDTARHFETLSAIRGMIDSLTYAKLNVLHWHMSDTQSFPMQSKTYPLMWEGAWSDQERYTQADIASVVEYARLRGVRVMVSVSRGVARGRGPGSGVRWQLIAHHLIAHLIAHLYCTRLVSTPVTATLHSSPPPTTALPCACQPAFHL